MQTQLMHTKMKGSCSFQGLSKPFNHTPKPLEDTKKGANTSYLIMFTHSFTSFQSCPSFVSSPSPEKNHMWHVEKKPLKSWGRIRLGLQLQKTRDLKRPWKDCCLEKKIHPGGCAISFRLSRINGLDFQT